MANDHNHGLGTLITSGKGNIQKPHHVQPERNDTDVDIQELFYAGTSALLETKEMHLLEHICEVC